MWEAQLALVDPPAAEHRDGVQQPSVVCETAAVLIDKALDLT